MRDYVAGFAFSRSCTEVLLIKKERPAWQAGHWNGLGGKIVSGEDWNDAMCRKAHEEAGLDLDWERVVSLLWEGTCVHVYAVASNAALRNFQQRTDEELRIHSIGHMAELPVVNALRFVIPLCAHHFLHERLDRGTVMSFDGLGDVLTPESGLLRRVFGWPAVEKAQSG